MLYLKNFNLIRQIPSFTISFNLILSDANYIQGKSSCALLEIAKTNRIIFHPYLIYPDKETAQTENKFVLK